jgi:hypothetical protein
MIGCSGLQGDSVSASCLLEAQPPHAAKLQIENNSDSPTTTTTREKGRLMNSLSFFIVVALDYQQWQQPLDCQLLVVECASHPFNCDDIQSLHFILQPNID